MATTTRITATTSADTSFTASVASGVVAQFSAFGLSGTERIIFEAYDGTSYHPFIYVNAGGSFESAELNSRVNVIRISGPIDIRASKSVTAAAVGLFEYT